MTITEAAIEIATPTGPMRAMVLRPAEEGRKFPGLVLYSEIFQITGPIHRTGAYLAGHGYVVVVPEIYHELEPAGTVLAYDQAGADVGNADKFAKEVSSWDTDARAALDYLKGHDACTGKLGVMGICIGGHLAFRAAMNPQVLGTVCFYATDIHKGGLGFGMKDDSIARAGEIKGELLMVWGRQDPHIPTEGRMKVLERLNEVGTRLNWHEVNGAHAFLRDEGARYDAEHARSMFGLALGLFHRTLAVGIP